MSFSTSTSTSTKVLLAVIAGAVSVSAHGHVSKIHQGSKVIEGFNPFTIPYMPESQKPKVVGWGTTALDNGFVLPSAFGTRDIACHKGSTNAQASVTVAGGETLTLEWDTWPDSHKGPVLDYLAPCGTAGCASVDVTSLSFFKIDEAGLQNGVWASDKLMADGMKWDVTIPAGIAPGEYVLRHEMIGLHEGNRANGAQMYPQCVNLVVTGSGTATPAGVKATELYTANEPGILFNIYNNPTSYPIPGPKVFSAGGGGGGSNPPPATTTRPTTTARPTTTRAPTTSPSSTLGSGAGNGGADPPAPTSTTKPTTTKPAPTSTRPAPTTTSTTGCGSPAARARRAARKARRAARMAKPA